MVIAQGQVGIFWDPREPPPPAHLLVGGRAAAAAAAHVAIPPPPQPPSPPPEPGRRIQADEFFGGGYRNGFLPPVASAVKAEIVHDTARVSATYMFVNDTRARIPQASYTFPLPPGCTVTAFSCRVGRDRVLVGLARPREEAAETFAEGVRRQETAALLAQENDEIFTTVIGNLPAGTRVKATVEFITVLKYGFSDGQATTTFMLPVCIAPRYGTPPVLISRSSDLVRLSVEVNVLCAKEIQGITSSSHNIDYNIGGAGGQRWVDFVAQRPTVDSTRAFVKLLDIEGHLDRDFCLDIRSVPEISLEEPLACVENHPSLRRHKALMVTVPPQFMLRSQNGFSRGEIIFVADRSGSMGDKIEALQSALGFFLGGLPESCFFNVWSFGSTFASMWPQSRQNSEAALAEARAHVSGPHFHADLGGTELLPALKAAVIARATLPTLDVVVLTDGQIWDLKQTTQFVGDTCKISGNTVRFFSLGIGPASSHALVEGIAKNGGGYAEVIPNVTYGCWEERVVAVLSAALTGHIAPPKIEFECGGDTIVEDLRGTHGNILQSPISFSTVSPFLRSRLFVMFESGEEHREVSAVVIKTCGTGGDENVLRIPVQTLADPGTTLHKFAARSLLGDLEHEQSFLHLGPDSLSAGSSELEAAVQREGERIGCKWSLVSKWTSFVAVQGRVEREPVDPFLDEVELPPPPPPPPTSPTSPPTKMRRRLLDLMRPRGHQQRQPEPLPVPHGSALSSSDEESDGDESINNGETDSWRRNGDNGGGPGGSGGAGASGNRSGEGGAGGASNGGAGGTRSRDRPNGRNNQGPGPSRSGGVNSGNRDADTSYLRRSRPAQGQLAQNKPLWRLPTSSQQTAVAEKDRPVAQSMVSQNAPPTTTPSTIHLSRSIPEPSSRDSWDGDWGPHSAYLSPESEGKKENLLPLREKLSRRRQTTCGSVPEHPALGDLDMSSGKEKEKRTSKFPLPSFLSTKKDTSSYEYKALPKKRLFINPEIPDSLQSWAKSFNLRKKTEPSPVVGHGGKEREPDEYHLPSPSLESSGYTGWGSSASTALAAEFGSIISTPIHNPVSSLSYSMAEPSLPTSRIEAAKRALLGRLQSMQMTSGALSPEQVKAELGVGIRTVVEELAGQLGDKGSSPGSETLTKVATTIAVIALLRSHFDFCQDLWKLMESKARSYLGKSQGGSGFKRVKFGLGKLSPEWALALADCESSAFVQLSSAKFVLPSDYTAYTGLTIPLKESRLWSNMENSRSIRRTRGMTFSSAFLSDHRVVGGV